MKKKFITGFMLEAELAKAWDFCWQYFCEGDSPRQRWLTASDLEARLRCAAHEQLYGEKYGAQGVNSWGMGVQIRTPDGAGSLLDVCREWLARQVSAGRFVAHNFGRGHCSGMRFRPVGVDLTDAEKATLEQKAKRERGETLMHLYTGANWFNRRALCTANRKTKRAGYRAPRRSKADMTSDPAKVTCPRCLKLLAQQKEQANVAGN